MPKQDECSWVASKKNSVMYVRLKFSLLLICLLLVQFMPLIGQENVQLRDIHFDPNLTEEQNRFLNRQAHVLLEYSSGLLEKYPPLSKAQEGRESALFLLDAILHEPHAMKRPPVQRFLKDRLTNAINEIAYTKVEKGAKIWKLYNHSFVVRTSSVTIAFDLIRTQSEENMRKLVSQCDILFISHEHGDHWEMEIVRAFLEQGKPVLAPPSLFRDDDAIYKQVTHLERRSHWAEKIAVKGDKVDLEVVTYPGHQWENIENNVSLIKTQEGIVVVHTGDQWNMNDFEWIDVVGEYFEVDVLLPNSWTADIARMANGVDPKVIISGHENEMGHALHQREPFWKTYLRKQGAVLLPEKDKGYDYPLVMMTWGEAFHYSKQDFH